MNAALGGVSAGGTGTPLFEVTHCGGGPSALVDNQSVGNAGGVTLSKFSFNVTKPEHRGHGLSPESCAIVGATATPAMSKSNKTTFRSRISVSMCFRFLTDLTDIRAMFLPELEEYCQIFTADLSSLVALQRVSFGGRR